MRVLVLVRALGSGAFWFIRTYASSWWSTAGREKISSCRTGATCGFTPNDGSGLSSLATSGKSCLAVSRVISFSLRRWYR